MSVCDTSKTSCERSLTLQCICEDIQDYNIHHLAQRYLYIHTVTHTCICLYTRSRPIVHFVDIVHSHLIMLFTVEPPEVLLASI